MQDGVKMPLNTWAPNEAHTYRFSVKLDAGTTNVDQNKTATALFQWDSVQEDGTTYNQ